ncbi:MAG: ABC transporter ATP-binding protein [Planctomycetes bacterium]|nr:ABC transporter ATP-binding protein [Planctomycetota bacterium]
MAQLIDLRKSYRMGADIIVEALCGVNLSIEEGQYVAIMGPSGSGKSTLLNLMGCLDRPTTGRYILGGQDVSDLSDSELSEVRGRQIGFIFQSFNLVPQLTALDNIEVPLFYQGMHRRDRRHRSLELAERVGLGPRARHKPMELSGGEQQRVAIARALANDPLILLADEPTGNLDSRTGQEILGLFDDLSARGGTIIVVTHDENVGRRTHSTVRVADGNIVSHDKN